MKFIEGHWYHCSGWAKPNDYLKYVSHSSDSFVGLGRILGGNYNNDFCAWHMHGEFTEATQKELKKYLPKGHPDLVMETNYEIY